MNVVRSLSLRVVPSSLCVACCYKPRGGMCCSLVVVCCVLCAVSCVLFVVVG